jgi:transposase
MITAATLVAVIGYIRRFPTSRQLVGYLGLHPTVSQSGNGPARRGRQVATVAVARKLAVLAWNLLTRDETTPSNAASLTFTRS